MHRDNHALRWELIMQTPVTHLMAPHPLCAHIRQDPTDTPGNHQRSVCQRDRDEERPPETHSETESQLASTLERVGVLHAPWAE